MKHIKLFESFDPKSEREVTSPKVISKLAELSNYLQSTDVYGLSIQGYLSAPPSGWTSNQWPIDLRYANYNTTKGAECVIHFNCDLDTSYTSGKTPHILILDVEDGAKSAGQRRRIGAAGSPRYR